MSLATITKTEVIENGIAQGHYKKFDVCVSQVGCQQFKFNIGIALDGESDATHWLAIDERAGNITEVKDGVKEIVNDYGYSVKDILILQKKVDLCNHGPIGAKLLDVDDILKNAGHRRC